MYNVNGKALDIPILALYLALIGHTVSCQPRVVWLMRFQRRLSFLTLYFHTINYKRGYMQIINPLRPLRQALNFRLLLILRWPLEIYLWM